MEPIGADKRRDALQKFITSRNESLNAWCLRAKVSESGVRGFLVGRSQTLTDKTYRKLAAAAEVSVTQLIGEELPRRQVPVVGYVGAGAQVFPVDDHTQGQGMDMIDAPVGAEANGVAVIVRGDSMFPAYWEGDVLFYHRDYDFARSACLYNECIVKVIDGPTLLKQIMPSSRPGLLTLNSYNAPPILDVAIEWAAPVEFVDKRQRRFVRTG